MSSGARRRGGVPLALLLVGALLVPAAVVLVVAQEAEAAPFVRTLAINTTTAQPKVPFAGFDGNPLKVYDIDGDGDQEILAQNDNQWLYVFDSRDGTLLAELKTVFPPSWGARTFNGPEVSILEEGGKVHLILLNSAATLTSYTYDPVASTGVHLAFTKDWERRLSDCYSNPGADSKPVLADLDRDGTFEVVVATEESGIYAVRADGALYWAKCIGGGNAEPTVADLNLDGWPDVVFGSDGGVVTAMNGRTGATTWSYNLRSAFKLGSSSIPVGVAVGQLNGEGLDVVGGARDSHNVTDYSQDHALLFALDHTGKLLWGAQDANGGNPLTYTHPIIADLANDGTPEVYWGDWNTIGHKGGIPEKDYWKVTGPANFYRYDNQGNLVWKQSLGTYWSNKDLAIGDVDDDGVQEILANGPNGLGHDGVWMLDSRTGAKESFLDLHPWKAQRGPILANLHGDGRMDLAIEAGPAAAGAGSGGALLVYDLGVPYDAAWPHLPYAQLGPVGPPPPPPPPPGGYFESTFRLSSPNAYWQQVKVTPSFGNAVARVEVRVNEGAWRPMTLQSYGDWTSSYGTPAGSKVEFLASSTSSPPGLSQSAPFTWMDGTLQKGSSNPPPTGTSSPTSTTAPPTTTSTTSTTSASTSTTASNTTTSPPSTTTTTPPPSGFTATFTVPGGVNEWWVEVRVDGNEPVAAVGARVNAGAEVALAKQSWGSWAKSFYVAPGSQVVFHATSANGGEALSAPFTWGAPPPTPPPGAAFNATFSPKAIGNDWWVETGVTANQPIAKVEAQVNGGAWTQLPATSWGTYAKSINAPNGSSVAFRATSTGGSTVTSGPTIWT